MSRTRKEPLADAGDPLVGSKEAAEICGVPPSSIARWARRTDEAHKATESLDGHFPLPRRSLSATPVWDENEVREFARARAERRAPAVV